MSAVGPTVPLWHASGSVSDRSQDSCLRPHTERAGRSRRGMLVSWHPRSACAFLRDRSDSLARATRGSGGQPDCRHGTRRLCMPRGGLGARRTGGRPLRHDGDHALDAAGDVQIGRRACRIVDRQPHPRNRPVRNCRIRLSRRLRSQRQLRMISQVLLLATRRPSTRIDSCIMESMTGRELDALEVAAGRVVAFYLPGELIARDVQGAADRTHAFDVVLAGGGCVALDVMASADTRVVSLVPCLIESGWHRDSLTTGGSESRTVAT
jgi:hypothetical protein